MPILKNAKHEAFARAVAEGKSGTQAYRANVAREGSLTETCMCEASKLLSDPKISQRVEELQAQCEQIAEKRYGFGKQKLIGYLIEVLETPVGDLNEDHRLANEVTYEVQGGNARGKLKRGNADEGNEIRSELVEVAKIKGVSKADAYKQLATLCGWNEPEKIDIKAAVAIPGLEEAVKAVFAPKGV
jgi:hypothetical protein